MAVFALNLTDFDRIWPKFSTIRLEKMMNPQVKEQGRLAELDGIEKELSTCMQAASNALSELSKDVPKPKQVETQTNSFLTSLHKVESELSKQIHYLTQVSSGQSHEGSVYASAKTLSMGRHRIEHAKLRLAELDRVNSKYNSLARDHPLQIQLQSQNQPGQGMTSGGQGVASGGQGMASGGQGVASGGQSVPGGQGVGGQFGTPGQGQGTPIGQQPGTGQSHQTSFQGQGHQAPPPQSPFYNPGSQGYH